MAQTGEGATGIEHELETDAGEVITAEKARSKLEGGEVNMVVELTASEEPYLAPNGDARYEMVTPSITGGPNGENYRVRSGIAYTGYGDVEALLRNSGPAILVMRDPEEVFEYGKSDGDHGIPADAEADFQVIL